MLKNKFISSLLLFKANFVYQWAQVIQLASSMFLPGRWRPHSQAPLHGRVGGNSGNKVGSSGSKTSTRLPKLTAVFLSSAGASLCRKETGVPCALTRVCCISIIAMFFLGGVPSGRLCGGERCLSPLDFSSRQRRSLFVPLGAGERRKASPQGTTGRGKRRSFRFSHLPSPRANYFSLLFFRVPVGTLSLLKRAHRGFIVSLPRGHVRKERVTKP